MNPLLKDILGGIVSGVFVGLFTFGLVLGTLFAVAMR